MDKRVKKQLRKKKVPLNFDFSDDSEDDFCIPQKSKHTQKQIKVKSKTSSLKHFLDEHDNSTIVSSEHLCHQAHLPSPRGGIGLPVMDSTHLFGDNNGAENSICRDAEVEDIKSGRMSCDERNLCKVKREKGKENVSPINGKFIHRSDTSPTSTKYVPSCSSTNSKSVLTSRNKFSHKSSESTSPKLSKELCESSLSPKNLSNQSCADDFVTVVEYPELLIPELESSVTDTHSTTAATVRTNSNEVIKSDETDSSQSSVYKDCNFNSSNCSNVCSSPDASVYYAQDISIQTSLPYNESIVSTHLEPGVIHLDSSTKNLSFSNCLKPPKTECAMTVGTVDNQSKCDKLGEHHSVDVDKYRTFHDLFENLGSSQSSPVNVLAAESNSDSNSDHDNSAVVADSDVDIESSLEEDRIFQRDDNDDECNQENESETASERSKFSPSEKSSPDTAQPSLQEKDRKQEVIISSRSCVKTPAVQQQSSDDDVDDSPDINAMSVNDRTSLYRTRKDSSSSSDDNFENFLNTLKRDKEDKNQERNVPSMEDFIIDDNASLSSEGANSGSDDNEEDDEELFYIRTTNELERVETSNRTHFGKITLNDGATGYDFSDSSDSSDCADGKFHDKSKAENNQSGKLEVTTTPGGKNQSEDRKKQKTDKTPLRGRPSPLTPRSDSISDDDFTVGKTGMPFSPGPFKTPKPKKKIANIFETPIKQKMPAPQIHPWTAPRLVHPSSASSSLKEPNSLFLKSLSEDCPDYKRHPEAARYVKAFKSLREDLTAKLFKIFNETVFDSKLPSSIRLEWNARYTKTAGTFSYKRIDPNMAKITLSPKVCDRPERVRDTLVHELCHAAVRLINGVNESHGPVWRSWARKVNKAYPFMPMVARCHDYIIHHKYTYQCVNCKYRIGRHSKSLDSDRKVCGHCMGKFEVFLTSDLNRSDQSTSATPKKTPRTPNKFALFVKECYSEVKKRNTDLKHGDIMKELSRDFAEKNKITLT